jgi:hypothetical protein
MAFHFTRYAAGAATLALLGSASPARAAAPEQLKTLRTLVYHVVYDFQSTYTQATSGMNGNGPSAGGSGTQRQDAIDKNEGTLTLNVVAATQDGGLVIDASFDGDKRSWRTVRIAIFPDGRMSYDMSKEVGPEGARVVPFLARGLLSEGEITPGKTWTAPPPKPETGTITYRVDSVEDPIAKMHVISDVHVAGAGAVDETTDTSLVYDAKRLCPTSVDLRATDRKTMEMNGNETTKIHIFATQTSDTFGT